MSVGGGDGHTPTYLEDVHGNTITIKISQKMLSIFNTSFQHSISIHSITSFSLPTSFIHSFSSAHSFIHPYNNHTSIGINKAQSESAINKNGKKTGHTLSEEKSGTSQSEKKPKKKKLVEADSRLNKSSLKDLLKGSMAMDEDEEDDLDTDSNMHNALMAIGAGLNSEGMLHL